MKEKTRKIFIMIVMAALIVSLMAASFAALTYGRYAGGRRDENSPYEDYIDFVGATAYEVRTPEQFVNAINSGYSYIKIADDADAEEPFVVNNNIANVYTNLVIDVNGNTVIRNSRNPVLDVSSNISVVLVYDSSEDAEGGFYNPVGSALQTSGGTLTVGEGVYESGPKIASVSSVTAENITDVFVRDGERDLATSYERASSAAHLPKLTKDVYLENNVTEGYLRNDTYLLYTVEKNGYVDGGQLYVNAKETSSGETTTITADKFSPICNVASCDFYYYYPVDVAGTAKSPQTYAVVYGYNDVKTLAEDCTDTSTDLSKKGLVWPYAAIRSVEDEDTQEGGVTHARGGVFKTHFGEENTYCIYSAGGTMTVGTSGSDGGPTFDAVGSGVCIAMTGASGNVSEGGSLTISGGTFSSRLGNTIEMEGGNMTVTAGSFTKSRGKGIGSGDNAQITNQTAIIDIQGGTLTINGAAANSVTLTAGSADTDNGGTLENVFGILARGGEVSVGGCTLNIYGDYSAGVLSYDGTINLNDKTSITVTQSDTNKDNDNNTLLTSSAVSSEAVSSEASGEEHPINMSGNVTIESNGLGITARGTVNVTEGATTTVKASRGTGIYVNNGTFTVESDAKISVESTVLAGYAWGLPPEGQGTAPNIYNGVYVQGGSLISNGTLNVTFTGVQNDAYGSGANSNLNANTAYRDFQIKSYAVRVETAASGSDTEVKITAGTIINQVQYDEQGKEIAGGGGGVYVGGGTVTLGVENDNTGPTVRTTGTVSYSTSMDPDGGNWNYFLPQTGGPAVKVAQSGSVSSTLTVYGGTYTAQQGDGIVTVGGTSYIHNGTFIGRDYNANSGERAGPGASYSFKVYGGTANVYGGTFGGQENDNYINSSGAFVMGTSANSMGTANIYGGTFVVSEDNTGGQAGFSVYEYGNVVVDPGKGGEQQNLGGDVKMTGLAAGLVIESASNIASVEIKGGEFSSTRDNGNSDGVWYSNSNATLTISGGTFTGAARSGLYFEVNQWNRVEEKGNAFITGGTFIGKSISQDRYWINGAIGAPSSGTNEGVGYSIQIQDFIDCSDGKYIEYYSNANATSPDSSVALSSYIGMDRSNQKINQTTCRYNKVIIR